MSKQRIIKIKFHSIKRDLKDGMPPYAVQIKHGVGRETVRTISKCKTWDDFVAIKEVKRANRKPNVKKLRVDRQTELLATGLAKITTEPTDRELLEQIDRGLKFLISLRTEDNMMAATPKMEAPRRRLLGLRKR